MSTATSAAKATKKVTKKVEEVAAPAAPAPAAPAPAKEAAPAKATKKAAAKESAPAVPAPAAPAPAPVAPVVAAPAEAEAPVASVQDDVRTMLTQANTLRETAGAIVAELKRLEKRVARLQKEADKRKRRGKKVLAEGEVAPPRKPSIFETPTALSPELCSFLGVAAGSKESRSNVTKAITKYVKDNNLKNKHSITPDAKLKALLSVKEGETLTYFNLQRYLNRHYIKTTA
jgi:chromatin remodeling complex protein RSC6